MKFKDAVEQTPQIKGTWQTGLGALHRSDRPHIAAADPRRFAGSVDLDAAIKDVMPNAPRWDYAIGYRRSNPDGQDDVVYWVEVHPASAGEVKVVLAKLSWLKKWLRENAAVLNSLPREFIWVSSGKTSFTLSSPQQKRFALHGLQYKGRVFKIPD